MAKALARAFPTADELSATGESPLAEVEDVGEVIANSLTDGYGDGRNRKLTDHLRMPG